jgi:probable FeS assembly SUF system protein SufT
MTENSDGYQTLTRSVQATQIPSGQIVELKSGTSVMITQALGGTFTVVAPSEGGLFRINGSDADALGKENTDAHEARKTAPNGGSSHTKTFSEEKVWEQLRNCYDPEIPVNIVDLGLIYSLDVADAPAGGKNVEVKMTLTAPGCGMGPALARDAQQRIMAIPGVAEVNVELVWDPPWSPERISVAGREKLGMV